MSSELTVQETTAISTKTKKPSKAALAKAQKQQKIQALSLQVLEDSITTSQRIAIAASGYLEMRSQELEEALLEAQDLNMEEIAYVRQFVSVQEAANQETMVEIQMLREAHATQTDDWTDKQNAAHDAQHENLVKRNREAQEALRAKADELFSMWA